jgi:hypothetical protein
MQSLTHSSRSDKIESYRLRARTLDNSEAWRGRRSQGDFAQAINPIGTLPPPATVPVKLKCDLDEYYCTIERHLAKLRSKYATPVYCFALRLSRKSGRFYASQIRMANYFGCSRRTMGTTFGELERGRFFRRISTSRFQTNVYMVQDHPAWTKENPGQCVTKCEMPWSNDGPDLGRQLYAISGGRVKFRPEQIKCLTELFSEEEIEHGFRRLLETRSVALDRHGFIRMEGLDWEALCWDI